MLWGAASGAWGGCQGSGPWPCGSWPCGDSPSSLHQPGVEGARPHSGGVGFRLPRGRTSWRAFPLPSHTPWVAATQSPYFMVLKSLYPTTGDSRETWLVDTGLGLAHLPSQRVWGHSCYRRPGTEFGMCLGPSVL